MDKVIFFAPKTGWKKKLKKMEKVIFFSSFFDFLNMDEVIFFMVYG